MIVLPFTAVVILYRLQSRYHYVLFFSLVSCVKNDIYHNIIQGTCSEADTVKQCGDWEGADERCKSQNDSLVSIQDIQSNSLRIGHFPIWSSVKGTFTPWIAYRGK